MARAMTVCFGVLLSLLLVPAAASAQGTSAATITGVVRDSTGAVLPGVTVEAASPALIERVRTTVTDDKGEYRITELRPGTYSITFSLAGFGSLKRDGIELTSNFTASIPVALSVGSVEETLTVTGATPLVDVQSVSQGQTVLKRDLVDAVPTSRTIGGLIALMPAIVSPPSGADVGGSMGESTGRLSIHGSKLTDGKQMMDGMRLSPASQNGGSRGHVINSLSAQEVVVETGGGGSAEYPSAGAVVNMIPRDGGNRFSGAFFTAGSTASMQADNLTDELRQQGLTSVNTTKATWDYNGFIAGPIVKDKLWFMVDSRVWGRLQGIPDLYEDSNYNDWVYTPDLSKPVEAPEHDRQHDGRITWQASSKDKFTYHYGWQIYHSSNNQGQLSNANVAWEVRGNSYCPTTNTHQITWTRPQSNKVLVEAGATFFDFDINQLDGATIDPLCKVLNDYAGVSESSPGVGLSPATWHGNSGRTDVHGRQQNARASMSYVTGQHHFKTGMFIMRMVDDNVSYNHALDTRGIPLSYAFTSGLPRQLTQRVSPSDPKRLLNPEFALFVQDQWTMRRLTINMGLRFEYLQESAAAVSIPAGPLSGANNYPEVKCIPCWYDLNPRLAVAYDLTGDAKTALKASINRYVDAQTTGIAATFAPNSLNLTTTRSWTDTNTNFFPDCDLKNPNAQTVAQTGGDACGAIANPNFGTAALTTTPDPNWITGWGNRGYAWTSSVELQREMAQGISVNVGWYHTWYGNQTVTDNTLVTPNDYSPYCVPVPTDSRLGDISGTQVCGLYNINPDKFSANTANQVTLASKFGKVSETFTGYDITGQARLPKGARVSGGVSVGNAVGNGSGFGALVAGKISQCFVVDSPQQLFNCEAQNPMRAAYRVNATIPLPWDMQGAAVFQNLPPLVYGATTTFTNAQVQPTLNRPLSGGAATVTVDLFAPYSHFLDGRINQLDLRASKKFKMGKTGIQLNADLYNVMNASPVLNNSSTYGTVGTATAGRSYLRPSQVLDARLFKAGVQFDF